MRTILIVEDNDMERKLLKSILKNMDRDIAEADTVATALLQLNNKNLDLIILDLKLPNGHGTAIINRIKGTRDDVPIIVLSGAIEGFEHGHEFPVTSVIEKPFDYIEFKEAVHKAIAVADTIRTLREDSRRLGDMKGE